MRVTIASGKGGTGKTLVATHLAWSLAHERGVPTVYVDADVEEPNGHLFLHPTIETTDDFTVKLPAMREETCSGCGACQRFCAFHAILALPTKVMVFPHLCHDCGGCRMVCPEDALVEVTRATGTIQEGTVDELRFLSGTLTVGEAMATPVIRGVLDAAPTDRLQIVDAPPGTSCPAMEAVHDADLVVLVTEPTPFGLHDLAQALAMARALDRRVVALINRSDLGDDEVLRFLDREHVPILGTIPFDRVVAQAYAEGRLAGPEAEALHDAIDAIARAIEEVRP